MSLMFRETSFSSYQTFSDVDLELSYWYWKIGLVESCDMSSQKNQKLIVHRHGHFDFLEMPLELREMIYKLVLDSSGRTRLWKRRWPRKVAQRKPLRSVPILLVSLQVYHEASYVLYKIGKAYFSISSSTRDRLNITTLDLKGVDLILFINFRHIDVRLSIYDCHVGYGKFGVHGAGKQLARMVDALGKAYK